MRTFGERLREERKRLILTQDEIAERLGITKQSQGLYERGQRTPNAEYLIGLFELGGDPAYVLTGTRTPPAAAALTQQQAELIEHFTQLTSEQQLFIVQTVAALAAANKEKSK